MEVIGWLLVIIMIAVIGLRADAIGKQLKSIDKKLGEIAEILRKEK